MKLISRIAFCAAAAGLALGVASNAQAGDKTTNTLLGLGLGGAAGAVFSDGDPLITLGTAAAGGVLGNVLTEDERDHRRGWRGHDRRNWRGHERRVGWSHDRGRHRGHYKKRHPHWR